VRRVEIFWASHPSFEASVGPAECVRGGRERQAGLLSAMINTFMTGMTPKIDGGEPLV
jgi:hypothetical protein